MRHTGVDFFEIGNSSKTSAAAIVTNVIQQQAKASRLTTNQVFCAAHVAMIDASMRGETFKDGVVAWH